MAARQPADRSDRERGDHRPPPGTSRSGARLLVEATARAVQWLTFPAGVLAGPAPGGCMRLLLIGAPGAGKGTQAVRLAEHFGTRTSPSGDLLRQHISDGSAIGRAEKVHLTRVDLLPDDLVIEMPCEPVVAADENARLRPRWVPAAPSGKPRRRRRGPRPRCRSPGGRSPRGARDDLVRRLLARRRGSVDTPDVIAHRLDVYDERTLPMLDYYAKRERLDNRLDD